MRICGLTKSYNGIPVFRDLSLDFSDGGTYCLTAPSGAGKTTLFRIILGLEEPDNGTVSGLAGKRLTAVFQEDRLLEGYTALKNLRFVSGNRFSDDELNGLLLRLLPPDALKKRVSAFSGGMRRRVEILRALIAPSDAILMDEPFSGLDPETKRAAADLIRELAKGRLLIVATHSAEDAGLLGAATVRLDPLPA